jgi:sugar O-acyltransferase (sialic acid O-acetyltransferase NeuD family)
MIKKNIILGSGGHARVLLDLLKENGEEIFGFVTPNKEQTSPIYFKDNDMVLYSDEEISNLDVNEYLIINGIGSLPYNYRRKEIFQLHTSIGFSFMSVIASTAIISSSAYLSEGVQVMPGAIIQSGAKIGKNTIVNTGAVIDHDCIIGKHNHIAPGAVLSGLVKTGNNVHIGTNASVIQKIIIGEDSIVGSGVSVTKDLPRQSTLFPAKPFLKSNEN